MLQVRAAFNDFLLGVDALSGAVAALCALSQCAVNPHELRVIDIALRKDATDAKGRRCRVNHAVRVTKAGVQYTFWAMMRDAPREHMQKAFMQRREQIVGNCVQLATDVEAYNDMKAEQPAIPMFFDFRNDVQERRIWENAA